MIVIVFSTEVLTGGHYFNLRLLETGQHSTLLNRPK